MKIEYIRVDLGITLSTALRKMCDSTITTISLLAVYNMDKELWGNYLDAVWKHLEKVISGQPSTWVTAIQRGSEDFLDISRCGKCEFAHIFALAFKNYTVDDWLSYTYYTVEQIKEYNNGK